MASTQHLVRRTRRTARHEELQTELFDLRTYNTRLLTAITSLLLGGDEERRRSIDQLIEMIDLDVRIADRMVRILEQNEDMRRAAPDLYRRALTASGARAA